jgi:hypothetical protein
LTAARDFGFKQRSAFAAAEFAQLELGMQRDVRPAGLRRHRAPAGARLPAFSCRTEIGAAQAAEAFGRIDRGANGGEAVSLGRFSLRRASAEALRADRAPACARRFGIDRAVA